MFDFNLDLAMSLLKDENEYPVNLDDAWQWLGYAKKYNAKEKLINNFEESIDYIIDKSIKLPETRQSDNHALSSPQELASQNRKEQIYLTVDCFKQLGMMAGTSKGKQVRHYFLDCEKLLKQQMIKYNQLTVSEQIVIQLSTFIDQQQKLNAALVHRTKRLDAIDYAASKHPGFRNVIEGELNVTDNKGYTVKTYCKARGVDLSTGKAIQMGQIASASYKLDKKVEPPKYGSRAMYFGNDIKYLDEAFDKVTSL